MKETINVASTYANDILINSDGKIFARNPGGPIRFIQLALEDANVPYESFNGEVMDVEILITDNGEFGKVPSHPGYRGLGEIGISKWIIVSTILDEWTLDNTNITDRLFIDLQGYVRDGDDFGRKKLWDIPPETAAKIYCVKGTEEEVAYIPANILEDQKQRLLIVTKGSEGADIYEGGKQYFIAPRPIDSPPDTIGAGDTFLAYFAAAIYRGAPVPEAGRYASNKTADFLESKLT